MNLSEPTEQALLGLDLPSEEIPLIVEALLDPEVSDSEKAAFLTALSRKGETSGELAAFARAILPRAIEPGLTGNLGSKALLDCCGTGGGGLNMVNVSTGIMFILAAAGVPVVKHGNRGMTKKCGSADVLEELGIQVEMEPSRVKECLRQVGIAFLYAPSFHPAFKAVGPVRKALAQNGQRTIFNLLGPLLNPVRPAVQLLGVFHPMHVKLFGEALSKLGSRRYLVVYGINAEGDPTGEVSVDGKTRMEGRVGTPHVSLEPPVPGRWDFSEAMVESREESAAKLLAAMKGEGSEFVRELLVRNASVALWVHGRVASMNEGSSLAREMITSGAALQKLEDWREFSKA